MDEARGSRLVGEFTRPFGWIMVEKPLTSRKTKAVSTNLAHFLLAGISIPVSGTWS